MGFEQAYLQYKYAMGIKFGFNKIYIYIYYTIVFFYLLNILGLFIRSCKLSEHSNGGDIQQTFQGAYSYPICSEYQLEYPYTCAFERICLPNTCLIPLPNYTMMIGTWKLFIILKGFNRAVIYH